MSDVFISYKKEDAPRVEPIARALAQAGYEVWWDHRIPPGRTYRDVIGAALQSAKCVIVVWSKLSTNAQWVLDEADEGKRRNVLLPLLIDDVEVPYGFRQIEAARLVGWSGDTSHGEWRNALASVHHFVGRAPGGPPKTLGAPDMTPRGRASAETRRRPSMIGPLAGAVAVAVLAAGGYYVWRHSQPASGRLAAAQSESSGTLDTTNTSAPSATSPAPTQSPRTRTEPAEETRDDASRGGDDAAPPARPPAPPLTEGVSRLTLVQGPYLVREPAGTWVEVDPRTGQSSYRWTEVRRDDDTIELRDAGRDAGMRIELREGSVYLYFPDWGAYRRQWGISGAERGRPQAVQSFACYWLSNGPVQEWRPMPQFATKDQCFAQDSCDGGLGRSAGGCYKWASGPDAPRQPW